MANSTHCPHPEDRGQVSASLVRAFDQCPLRAGFSWDLRYKSLRRTGLRAALGIAAHAVAARSGTGVEFESVWAEETAAAMEGLSADWGPARPPSVKNWPGSAITKARLRSVWDPTLKMRAPAFVKGQKHSNSHPALPWRERWLAPTGSGLVGRPDLVERVDGILRVVDLKTGVLQGAITGSQRRQLLLYCALVGHMLGEFPTRAAVQTADGQLEEFAVDPSEIDAAENHARYVLESLTAAAQGAHLEARPAESSCSTCPFRVVCSAFFDAYEQDWRCPPARLARLRSVVAGQSHSVWDVEVLAPDWAKGHSRWVAFPLPASASVGQRWAASDIEGRGGAAMARWNTLVAPWPET
ncbi:PD-(D/E)XK nuclease family protein [Serinicoccus profundi]